MPSDAGVVLMLDGDATGRRATQETADALMRKGHRVFSVDLPDGFDPAALYIANTPEGVR